jgi:hypothetical protein
MRRIERPRARRCRIAGGGASAALAAALACVLAAAPAYAPAGTVTLTIDSMQNIHGAGHAAAPGEGDLPALVPLGGGPGAGEAVTFPSVTGMVSANVGLYPFAGGDGADLSAVGGLDQASFGGISGLVSDHVIALTGVFTTDAEPADPAPPRLVFRGDAAIDFAELSPLLNQTFFIGDGRRADGTTLQRFNPPAGATQLWLGFADHAFLGGPPDGYSDNGGQLQVQVRTGTVIPLPPALLVALPGLALAAAAIRRTKAMRE